MRRRTDEALVGLLLVIAIAVGILGTIWLVRGGFEQGYPLYARFPWGAGLSKGQPVLLAGINVGYVAEAELDPNGTIVVEMRINDDYGIPINSTATVVPVGIFGDQAIALTPARAVTQYLPAGDTLPVGPGAPSIETLMSRVDSIGLSVADVAEKFSVELVQNGGIEDLRATLASTNALVQQLAQIAVQQSEELSLTNATLRRSLSALDSAQLDSAVRNLQRTTANAEVLTAELRTTALKLNSVLAAADSGDGTLARLLHDPGLYTDLRGLVARLDSLTLDVKGNPRRYLNLSIF
jgi:phospholipid/cholesterol/gamma-HCH transport system substrate-binding protein